MMAKISAQSSHLFFFFNCLNTQADTAVVWNKQSAFVARAGVKRARVPLPIQPRSFGEQAGSTP